MGWAVGSRAAQVGRFDVSPIVGVSFVTASEAPHYHFNPRLRQLCVCSSGERAPAMIGHSPFGRLRSDPPEGSSQFVAICCFSLTHNLINFLMLEVNGPQVPF